MADLVAKSSALLNFLRDSASLRRKRISTYGETDRVLWFADLPQGYPEIRSVFFMDKPSEEPDVWLEVKRQPRPVSPSVPVILKDLIEGIDEAQWRREPILKQEQIPSEADAFEVNRAWNDFIRRWQLWSQQMDRWEQIHNVYEQVDFMRRRLEEAEEVYELVVGVGLLTWQEPSGVTVKRHLLVAPAEIDLDASRGVLEVRPAASFDKFKVETDMLLPEDQPVLGDTRLEVLLEEIDVEVWNRKRIGEILRIIANTSTPDAEVDENALEPPEYATPIFRVTYSPALVLRQRRSTGYIDLVDKLIKATESASQSLTAPWKCFIREGDDAGDSACSTPEALEHAGESDNRLYFPLPTNDEQRRIAERLRSIPYVLVKGPPGTGKSHTIANLVCHLLAGGERVLVTAHAPKALAVLRDLLPEEIRSLCITALGATREDDRLLEESIRGVLARKSEWKGNQWAVRRIETLRAELEKLEQEIAKTDKELCSLREAETYSHDLEGDYRGTAAQIARQLEEQKSLFGWFPELSDECSCPLDEQQIENLSVLQGQLRPEIVTELRKEIGGFDLLSPSEFENVVALLHSMDERIAAFVGKDETVFEVFKNVPDSVLSACVGFLLQLAEHATKLDRFWGEKAREILTDLLAGHLGRWQRTEEELLESLRSAEEAAKLLDGVRVDIPSDADVEKLLDDARRRLRHFEDGGWRGVWILAPSVVRETNYVESMCLVDNRNPKSPADLEKVVASLRFRVAVDQFLRHSQVALSLDFTKPQSILEEIREYCNALQNVVQWFSRVDPQVIQVIPVDDRVDLFRREARNRWMSLLQAEELRRKINRQLALLSDVIRRGNAHECVVQMESALRSRDPYKWRQFWEMREAIRAKQNDLHLYESLVQQIREYCPELANMLTANLGEPEWQKRLLNLRRAWLWASARAWVRKVTDPHGYERLFEKRQALQRRFEQKTGELASLQAWHHFFLRLDSVTEQNLTAWAKAMSRIGKGTGKYAYRHRRAARHYLMACIPKEPAWIMPLYRLWDTVDAVPGVFDTVIIDEASQAGIEALILLLLAKRIVVVGDDKQNSPEAVGIPEDEIARLAREHLRSFRFRDEFRPDTSLYDHAERAFGNIISLREHFRCVPEIIWFSNELCYTDAPLIPLRQPPPRRLEPLKRTYVATGYCQGEGQRITNKPEAEEIVKAISDCLRNPAYAGKTMGVIVLQGHAQAELLERRIAAILDPKVRAERKLRCGTPATFQGDQRDVIFLSLVVAPNYNFRALTGLSDVRRFNVAMSRARDQVWLFHSVRENDLSHGDLRWRLLNFFYSSRYDDHLCEIHSDLERLEVAARRKRDTGNQPEPYESWFEVDVAVELMRRGYRVRPQVEVAQYRIDLVIEGIRNRLAVECDGDAWHGLEQYERDVARQRQLERAGWRFVRIRESEFYADRESTIGRVIQACDELGIRPVREQEEWLHTEQQKDAQAHIEPENEEEWEVLGEPAEGVDDEERADAPEEAADEKWIVDEEWIEPDEEADNRKREKRTKPGKEEIQFPTDPKTWFSLARWAKKHGQLTPKGRAFAYDVGRHLARGWDLSEKQAKWAQTIWQEAIERGFTPEEGEKEPGELVTEQEEEKPQKLNGEEENGRDTDEIVRADAQFPYDPETWFALAHWGKESGVLSPAERQFAFKVGKYSAKNWTLSDRMIQWANQIWQKAIQNGFSP